VNGSCIKLANFQVNWSNKLIELRRHSERTIGIGNTDDCMRQNCHDVGTINNIPPPASSKQASAMCI